MIAVKEILEKQWKEYHKMVKEFAKKDTNKQDEEYNYGRYLILNSNRIDFSDSAVDYYCYCNCLSLADVPGGIDDILRKAKVS